MHESLGDDQRFKFVDAPNLHPPAQQLEVSLTEAPRDLGFRLPLARLPKYESPQVEVRASWFDHPTAFDAAWTEVLPAAERLPRTELVRVANLYFEAIEKSSGDIVPRVPETSRMENGFRTAPRPPPADVGQAVLRTRPVSLITQIRWR